MPCLVRTPYTLSNITQSLWNPPNIKICRGSQNWRLFERDFVVKYLLIDPFLRVWKRAKCGKYKLEEAIYSTILNFTKAIKHLWILALSWWKNISFLARCGWISFKSAINRFDKFNIYSPKIFSILLESYELDSISCIPKNCRYDLVGWRTLLGFFRFWHAQG